MAWSAQMRLFLITTSRNKSLPEHAIVRPREQLQNSSNKSNKLKIPETLWKRFPQFLEDLLSFDL
jgi:hypothetical protein